MNEMPMATALRRSVVTSNHMRDWKTASVAAACAAIIGLGTALLSPPEYDLSERIGVCIAATLIAAALAAVFGRR
jgi:hypothetical protein